MEKKQNLKENKMEILFKVEGGGNLHFKGEYEITGADEETAKILNYIDYHRLAYAYSDKLENGLKKYEKGNEFLLETSKQELEELLSDCAYEDHWSKAKKKVKHKEIKNKRLKKAKETGEEQFYYSYNEYCNDSKVQCDVDLVNVYIKSNGETREERIHTY